jgi:uncharacterized cupredoxin-like copper-binding protein
VHAHEYRIALTRESLPAGRILIELINQGEDAHNLLIAPAGSTRILASFDTLASGRQGTQTVSLAPGSYRLWCSLPGHEALGMHAELTVS